MGFAAGQFLITWDYLQPPLEPGTEDYEEMAEEIDIILESSLAVTGLRKQGWIEEFVFTEHPLAEGSTHRDSYHDTISGVQGITMKFFRHPVLHCTMMVFFAGFGVEQSTEILHQGLISSLIKQAVDTHMAPLSVTEDLTAGPCPGVTCGILSYTCTGEQLRTGEVYTVLTFDHIWESGNFARIDCPPVLVCTTNSVVNNDMTPPPVIVQKWTDPDGTTSYVPGIGESVFRNAYGSAKVMNFLIANGCPILEGESFDDHDVRMQKLAKDIYRRMYPIPGDTLIEMKDEE